MSMDTFQFPNVFLCLHLQRFKVVIREALHFLDRLIPRLCSSEAVVNGSTSMTLFFLHLLVVFRKAVVLCDLILHPDALLDF